MSYFYTVVKHHRIGSFHIPWKKVRINCHFYFLYVLRTIDFVRDRLLGVNNGWVNVYSDQDRNLPHGSPTTLIKIQYRTHYKIQKE